MDTVSTYSFANLAWITMQAIPLILWPSSIGALLRDYEQFSSTSLELYFARSLGLALLCLGLTVVVLSGAVPLGSSLDSKISPYANAALVLSSLHHASSGILCYTRYAWTGQTGYALGCAGSSILAVMALYCVMFAGDKAMISRYHKFDQSTSGFPFKNSASYRAKKKAL